MWIDVPILDHQDYSIRRGTPCPPPPRRVNLSRSKCLVKHVYGVFRHYLERMIHDMYIVRFSGSYLPFDISGEYFMDF